MGAMNAPVLTLRRGPGQALVDDYLHNAALPAFLRAGASPVGIFSIMIGLDSPGFYVLLVHKTLDAFAALPSRLSADAEYQTAAAPYLSIFHAVWNVSSRAD